MPNLKYKGQEYKITNSDLYTFCTSLSNLEPRLETENPAALIQIRACLNQILGQAQTACRGSELEDRRLAKKTNYEIVLHSLEMLKDQNRVKEEIVAVVSKTLTKLMAIKNQEFNEARVFLELFAKPTLVATSQPPIVHAYAACSAAPVAVVKTPVPAVELERAAVELAAKLAMEQEDAALAAKLAEQLAAEELKLMKAAELEADEVYAAQLQAEENSQVGGRAVPSYGRRS
jgi:hypothetical protein